MDYNGVGFSNIRLPNSSKSYIYKYNSEINTFPEEVFIHEFLHTLERNQKEYGYTVPALHDNEKYGYRNKALEGLKYWYQDYMRCNIQDIDRKEKIGILAQVYGYKPAQNSNFNYGYDFSKRAFKEPNNFFEDIGAMIKMIFKRN